MKTNIKIKFKDNTECVFDANSFRLGYDGFYDLKFIDEEDRGMLVASVSANEIKYLIFVEVEDDTEI